MQAKTVVISGRNVGIVFKEGNTIIPFEDYQGGISEVILNKKLNDLRSKC
jgi:hypothetical protein